MPTELELRLAALKKTRRAVVKRAADYEAALAAAPAWYHPGIDIHALPAADRPLAERLEQGRAVVELDREALAELDQELQLLGADPNRLKKCVRRALQWINTAETWQALVKAFLPDPANRLLGELRPRRLSKAMAQAIIEFRDAQPHHRIADLRDLLHVPGVDEALLRDLVYSGCRWQPPAPQPFRPTLGVLLPVRLETRFYAPAGVGQSWKLRLRIVPDHASIDRHDPLATTAELDDVERMWQQAKGDLTTEKGKAAWRAFMSIHRPRRAAWLARTFPPLPPDASGVIHIAGPAQVATEPRMSRLRGLPPRLQVWLARGGAPPAPAATLVVHPGAADLDLPTDLEDPAQERWWSSYTKAEALGLAVEIDLGPAFPGDIDALYVTGLGSEAPDALFQAHRDAGQLAVVAPGTPTNTVDGQPASDLGSDPETWRQVVLKAATGEPGTEQVSQALTGRADALGPLPGGAASPRDLDLWLVQSLWPALWGHAFKDIWGLGGGVTPVGLWAGDNLVPEGPVPALRIGNQPYGILPTTTLARWQAAGSDPACEAQLRPYLTRLRQAWAEAARANGTVAGAGTEKLLDLIGQVPTGGAYAYRLFIALEYFFALLGGFDQAISMTDLDALWRQFTAEELAYPLDPQRRYVSIGWPQDITIPLVQPDNLPDGMSFKDALWSLAGAGPRMIASGSYIKERFHSRLPNSLLFRLLMYSVVVAAAEVTRAQHNIHTSVLEPIAAPEGSPTRLQQDAFGYPGPQPNLVESRLYDRLLVAIQHLADVDPKEIERAFRAVLDTAMVRIDPWITALPWRRARALAGRNPRYLLGLYGWVDHPAPGQPGPTAGGLLHAPSHAQALTAAILRDRALSDPEPGRWQMNLDSRLVRLANRIAGSVRLGVHIQEALGREVERIVGDPAQIKQLRTAFPIRVEHAGRRVCNGQAVLAADLATLGLTAGQVTALEVLRQAVDVYGDLLVSEAVHHVVSGRAEIAAAAMDAAAGLAQPPSLEVIQTPRSGRSAATTVAFCLPNALAPAPAPATSPTRLADPAVAAWLEAQTGAPHLPGWAWTVRLADDSLQSVALADLGLEPCDTACLPSETLRSLVKAAVADAAEVLADGPADRSHARVRQLIALAGSRPAIPADLAVGIAADDSTVAPELRARYQTLYDVCADLIDQLTAAADDAAKRAGLLSALRWGVVPLPDANPTLDDQVKAALSALSDRCNAAPVPPAGTAALGAEAVARATAELATADGRYAVLGRIDFNALQGLTVPPTVLTAEARPDPNALNPLDTTWLQAVATVRPTLARLEVYQLERLLAGQSPPLFAWTNRPGDPWQVNVAPDPATGRAPATRLVVLYGPENVLAGLHTCAVGLLDAWSETVPETDHATTAAFGFNAPAARAPQAILLAVPPVEDAALDDPTLVDILAETRALAHARMARRTDLAAYSGAIPTLIVPASGVTAVNLEKSEV